MGLWAFSTRTQEYVDLIFKQTCEYVISLELGYKVQKIKKRSEFNFFFFFTLTFHKKHTVLGTPKNVVPKRSMF